MLQKKVYSFLCHYKRILMIIGLVVFTCAIIPEVAIAQSGLKITSLDQVKEKAKEGADVVSDTAKYVIGSALVLALVFVVWALATNNPHAKEYLIGWVIAVIAALVGFLVV